MITKLSLTISTHSLGFVNRAVNWQLFEIGTSHLKALHHSATVGSQSHVMTGDSQGQKETRYYRVNFDSPKNFP